MINSFQPDKQAVPGAACLVCGSELDSDEIALTKKLINRGAKEYMCLACLSRKFDVSVSVLREKIIQYREMGCTLFKLIP